MEKYYDTKHKRTFWMLGYFRTNVQDIYNKAKEFQEVTKVPFETIHFDEILSSRIFKSMYIMFSTQDNQENLDKEAEEMEEVYGWFRD